MENPKRLLTNELLELIRDAKQVLLERKQRCPFLFSKHSLLSKKSFVKPKEKSSSFSFVPPSSGPLPKSSELSISKVAAASSSPIGESKKAVKAESLLFQSLRALIQKSCPTIRLTDKIP